MSVSYKPRGEPPAFTLATLDARAPLTESQWESFRKGKPTEDAMDCFQDRLAAAHAAKMAKMAKMLPRPKAGNGCVDTKFKLNKRSVRDGH